MSQSAAYKNFKKASKANTAEAEALERAVDMIINNKGGVSLKLPSPVKTPFGIALAMAIMTFPAKTRGIPNQPWQKPDPT